MKNKLIMKLFASFLIICILTTLISSNALIAKSQGELVNSEDIGYSADEKIMEYDIATGETKEIDMEKIRKSRNNVKSNYINSIDSSEAMMQSRENINFESQLYSASSANRITSTGQPPYSRTCRVKCKDSKGNNVYGTAAIVGSNLALTSAHLIFDAENNNKLFTNWELYPGYNNGTYYGIKSGWSKIIYSSNYLNTGRTQDDWAICVLNENVGDKVGYYGLHSYTNDSDMLNLSVRVLGYPADTYYGFSSDAKYMYQTGDEIISTYAGYFKYTGWTFGGFSGGPVLSSDDYIIGIHRGITSGYPTATRISQNMLNIISEYR